MNPHDELLKITARGHAGATPTDELWLPYDLRKRGRLKATTSGGRAVGLFLERGEVLRDGELLRADDATVIAVRAAPEDVATATTDDPLLLARACYHLGNRHVPLQVDAGRLRFQSDPVLEDLATRLGLGVVRERAPFHPEPGAYHGGGHAHGHGHHHDHA